MGLFGSKKDKKTGAIADFFTPEELRKIREVLGPKVASGEYGQLQLLTAKVLLADAENPDEIQTYHKLNGTMQITKTVAAFEPSLEAILKSGYEKFEAFSKS